MTPSPDRTQRLRKIVHQTLKKVRPKTRWPDEIIDSLAQVLADAQAQERETCVGLLEQRIGLSFTLDDELREIIKAIHRRGGTP